jgi:hypothetical protein
MVRKLFCAALLALFSTAAYAQLEPYTDYDISKELYSVTLVQVDPNMDDDYLEGLAQTWVASNRVAKELGQIKDFAIYRSQVPQSGHANLFLVVEFTDSSQLEPNKEQYDKFMQAWGEANRDKSREITADYPSMRKITGEYLLRRIDIK